MTVIAVLAAAPCLAYIMYGCLRLLELLASPTTLNPMWQTVLVCSCTCKTVKLLQQQNISSVLTSHPLNSSKIISADGCCLH